MRTGRTSSESRWSKSWPACNEQKVLKSPESLLHPHHHGPTLLNLLCDPIRASPRLGSRRERLAVRNLGQCHRLHQLRGSLHRYHKLRQCLSRCVLSFPVRVACLSHFGRAISRCHHSARDGQGWYGHRLSRQRAYAHPYRSS